MRKEKSASKGKRDIVKVNVRVLSKVGYEQKWVSASINYDKKGETFVNEVSDINNNTLETEVTGICYVSKDKLSDFKAERYGQSINGLPKSLDSVRKILLANSDCYIALAAPKQSLKDYFYKNTEFENDLKLANDCLVNNPLLKLILNIKSTSDYGGYRVDKNSKEFKDIESVLSDNLNLR